VGNVEARELPLGGCDVAVADGFTGNVVLKLTEGMAKMILGGIKEIFMSSLTTKLAALLVAKPVQAYKKRMDASEIGGALLLGVRRPVIKAHGNSNGRAFMNAIRQAALCCENHVVDRISASLGAAAEDGEA
jgi:glycerol-3-phosphate acyltransferase PlsX